MLTRSRGCARIPQTRAGAADSRAPSGGARHQGQHAPSPAAVICAQSLRVRTAFGAMSHCHLHMHACPLAVAAACAAAADGLAALLCAEGSSLQVVYAVVLLKVVTTDNRSLAGGGGAQGNQNRGAPEDNGGERGGECWRQPVQQQPRGQA